MSLPKLTAFIGKTIPVGLNDEFSSLIKNLKKVKENEEAFIVFFVMDLQEGKIDFKLGDKLTEDSIYKYYFFGNNASAGTQYYLSRDVVSLKYLLKSTFSDLHMMLDKNNIADGELGSLLKVLGREGFIELVDKKGKGAINLDKFSIINDELDRISLDDKDCVIINEVQHNPEAFIRLFIEDNNKKNKFVLVVPKVVLENGEEVILSTHPEYLELVNWENKLGESEISKGKARVCYICKKSKSDVSSDYSTKFDRTGINKIFTTTTVNFAPYFAKKSYDDVYSVCSECYLALRQGEKQIAKQFKSKIAGEDVFLLPEGMLQDFDYKFLNILKTNIDLAFKSPDAEKWINTIESEKLESDIDEYAINFIFYRTDGNSVAMLETIVDVPTIKFERIMGLLSDYTKFLKPHTDNISIGSIYSLIPVKVNKKGVQLNIGRVLSFYKAVLSGEKVSHRVLFDYAMEALENGLKQLNKAQIDNYFNLGLIRFVNGKEDFFIRRIIYGYLVLFKVCQELGILDKEILKTDGKVDGQMDYLKTPSKEVNSSIKSIEDYLEKQGFKKEAKALFYLGFLVNRVATEQMQKEHKTKPILKKIQFQGMNEKEIFAFYNEVVEKLRQYNILTLLSECIINRFHYYFGSLDEDWTLSDNANVFYIMAGYSFRVGWRQPDYKAEDDGEKAVQAELNNDE